MLATRVLTTGSQLFIVVLIGAETSGLLRRPYAIYIVVPLPAQPRRLSDPPIPKLSVLGGFEYISLVQKQCNFPDAAWLGRPVSTSSIQPFHGGDG